MVQKAQQHDLQTTQRLRDRVLFTQIFYIETTRTPRECVERLRTLAHKRRGLFYSSSRTLRVWSSNTKVNSLEFGGFGFDLRLKRHGRSTAITHAKITGTIQWSSLTGMTIMRGEIQLGKWVVITWVIAFVWIPIWFVFAMALFDLSQDPRPELKMTLVTLVMMHALFWLSQPLRDYHRLYHDFHQVLAVEKYEQNG